MDELKGKTEQDIINEAWDYLVKRAPIDNQIANMIQENFKELFVT